MITITLPAIPLIIACAFLVMLIFMFTTEQFSLLGGITIIVVPILVFFMIHGFMAMTGGY